MLHLKSLLLTSAFSVAALLPQAHANTLILGAPSDPNWNFDVQAQLTSTGLLSGSIDVLNAASNTPTLALLQSYDAVFVYSDSIFADQTALGNVLADYVDSGGGVVEATFSFSNYWGMGGRWVTGGYGVWGSGGQDSPGGLTLGTILQPGSPILAGVTSFNGGYSSYHNTPTSLSAGAVAVANWSNGVGLIAENTTSFAGRVVGLNFYPVSSDARYDFWDSSTDGAKIMANAVNHVSSASAVPDGGRTVALLGIVITLFAAYAAYRTRRA